jgi:spore coat protein A
MLSRRIFERSVFNAAASVQTTHRTSGPIRSGIALMPYLDPLPIPPVLRPQAKTSITMRAAKHQAHRDLPPSTIWGYNGIWPGPTIETHRGQPLIIHWTNHLPEEHFLPLDPTIHGSETSLPEVRTVAHLHGAFVSPDSDGYPDAWFTSSGKTGPRFRSRSSSYPNEQPAATLWYHDHCIGITRLNIYAGLAGFYLIRDAEEDQLNLPTGAFDIPLMLQDRLFQHDGSLLYPKAVNGTHPVWIQEFFGDTVCVNGKATPYLEVEPRRYRFRILNASNARFYQLRLHHADESGQILGKAFNVPLFEQIAADGGLLPAPVSLRYLLIAPGERMDLIVDFSPFANQCFTLDNSAPAPYTMGGEFVPTEVMLFKVNLPLSGKETSSLPKVQIPFAPIEPTAAIKERILPLTEIERPSDGDVVTSTLGNARWHDPITENPKAGSIEIWSFLNTTADMHPIHLHLVRFQVLNRQPFDVAQYLINGEVAFLGPPIPPEPNEYPAWKDTVKAYPGHLTRIIQKFDLPANSQLSPQDDGFLYVWHCHILEHEDNEMMRPFKVRL